MKAVAVHEHHKFDSENYEVVFDMLIPSSVTQINKVQILSSLSSNLLQQGSDQLPLCS